MLQNHLREDRIIILNGKHSFNEAIQALCEVLASSMQGSEPGTVSAEKLAKAVLQREQAGSTALGFGCAIPHAAVEGLVGTYIGAAILKTPLALPAPDSEKVDILFLMLGPASEARTHLKLLSRLARIVHSEEVRKSLRSCENARRIMEVVCEQDPD